METGFIFRPPPALVEAPASTYMSPQIFHAQHMPVKPIGQGADGQVVLYRNLFAAGSYVVVKYTKESLDTTPGKSKSVKRPLQRELATLRALGPSSNIVALLGWDEDQRQPGRPALYLEYATFGDVRQYRQGFKVESGIRVPEEIVWKLMVDMSKALAFLHSNFPEPYVHGDVKSENILVYGDLAHPENPTFKLADFGRAVYAPKEGSAAQWKGTWSYAPPAAERKGPITPAIDIWALGSVVQYLVYGKAAVARTSEFQEMLIRNNHFTAENIPDGKALSKMKEWRDQWPRKIRNIAKTGYSRELCYWYLKCMDPDKDKRITAMNLVTWFIPTAEMKIRALVAERDTPTPQPCGQENPQQ